MFASTTPSVFRYWSCVAPGRRTMTNEPLFDPFAAPRMVSGAPMIDRSVVGSGNAAAAMVSVWMPFVGAVIESVVPPVPVLALAAGATGAVGAAAAPAGHGGAGRHLLSDPRSKLVAGAALSDLCLVGNSAALPTESQLSCEVTAANTAQVTHCCSGVAACDPADMTYTVKVIKP